jgi:hypothetical protein
MKFPRHNYGKWHKDGFALCLVVPHQLAAPFLNHLNSLGFGRVVGSKVLNGWGHEENYNRKPSMSLHPQLLA